MGKVGLVQDVVVVEALGAETGGALVGSKKKLGRRSYSGCVMRSPAVLPLLAGVSCAQQAWALASSERRWCV
jgi:hypothetical protein